MTPLPLAPEGAAEQPQLLAASPMPPVAFAESTARQSLLAGFDAGNAVLALALFVSLLWAYWPTLEQTAAIWRREPDYSHGFLVLPLALGFLWARRQQFPGCSGKICWTGLGFIALSLAMRGIAAHWFLEQIDGWSIMVWMAGMAWLFGGARCVGWALPSIAFLWFMFPLPYRAESWLSMPLRQAATAASCWVLQTLGQPAICEQYTILLGDHRLEVEQACAGLRIFMGVLALAVAYMTLARRAWWEQLAILAGIIPIALAANSARIVTTGLLYRVASDDVVKRFSHDMAGWLMIVLAAGMFAGLLWYLGQLIRKVEIVEISALVRRPDADRAGPRE